MRIACLQFAPQLGDVDNNLNRADAVLSKANPEDLDLLVLPELAFTGYNFKSLQEISPFLEPQNGSGISALWARTVALKYNCVTIVGYPEQADIKSKWPTSPEHYSSAIIINGEGETIGNYRKSFLYYTDETWALEGQEGFWEGDLPGLGHASMGICMDMNPYKFEAPWHAFEFAFHILEMSSNLVILTMAWSTREDGRMFSRMPNEPDLDTLSYWISRLEPLIRSDNDEEIIVVFCNRTGIEGDAVYAGTSAVIGIRNGEVSVYGLLGRGTRELLVVDTEATPYAKLVYRPDKDSGPISTNDDSRAGLASTSALSDEKELPQKSQSSMYSRGTDSKNVAKAESGSSKPSRPPQHVVQPISPLSETALANHMALSCGGTTKEYDYVPLGRRSRAGSEGSTKSIQGSISSRHSVNSKTSRDSRKSKESSRTRTSKDSVGSKGPRSHRPRTKKVKLVSIPTQIPSSRPAPTNETVPTPTGPSPTPLAIRPKLIIPNNIPRRPHIPTPHPAAVQKGHARIYGGEVSIQQQNTVVTPSTAFDDETPLSPNKFFWIPSDTLLQTPMQPHAWTPALADSPTLEMVRPMPPQESVNNATAVRIWPSDQPNTRSPKPRSESKPRAKYVSTGDEPQPETKDKNAPERPPSPKSRNASRSRKKERSDSALGQKPDLAAIAQRLGTLSPRPDSAVGQRAETFSPRPGSALSQRSNIQSKGPDRPSSPKSRNASRTRPENSTPAGDPVDRHSNASRASILIAASPGIFDSSNIRGPSAMFRSESHMSNVGPSYRPMSRTAHSRSNSAALSYDARAPVTPEVSGVHPQSRTVSRGRQPITRDSIGTVDNAYDMRRDSPVPARRPSAPSIGFRTPAEYEAGMKRISPEWSVAQGGSHASGDDDEIVEEIIVRRSPSCAIHGSRRSQSDTPGQDSNQAPATPELKNLPKQEIPNETPSQTSKASVEQSPGTYASSTETPASAKGSPATPPFSFEPKTPKAMLFTRDDDHSIPITPLSAPFIRPLKLAKCIGQEAVDKVLVRPRSAIW